MMRERVTSSFVLSEVENYRTELEGVKVRGKNCPKPIKSWAQCGCSKKVMDVFKK
jgi:ATP-dependent RNA helicase DDX46/PRP5